jgi:shikimate kinase
LLKLPRWWRKKTIDLLTKAGNQPEEPPNLVLIGYRATGKTSVGEELARILKRHFVDLDRLLVAEAGQSVAEIVAGGGWAEFHRREVLDPENVELLRENGIIIWLTADPATIRTRLEADRPGENFRPSLTGGDTVNEVMEVLKSREPLYRAAAEVVVDTAQQSVHQVVREILAALEKRKEANLGR